MPVTVYDIAREAGVSRATVQRALLDKGRISPDTKARIKKIASELRYRPNQIALTLTLGKSNLIGSVLFPTIFTAPQMIYEPISQALRQAGYQMLFSTASGTVEDERLCLEQLFTNRVTGAIMICGPNPVHAPLLQELIDDGVKLVLIDSVLEDVAVPQLVADHYRAARLLTEHLISFGHSNIAHLAVPGNGYTARERRRGFTDAMTAAGLPVPESATIETEFSEQAGAEAAYKLLSRPDPPTALIARHDVVAMGAMDAILSAGLSIPGDISLVGTAGMWFTHALRVPLTTVEFPAYREADAAVTRLLAMLDGETVKPGIETVDVEFLERLSVGPPNPTGLREHLRQNRFLSRPLSERMTMRASRVPRRD